MRKESMQQNERADIKRLAYYHGSQFERLTFFNSDRPVYLDYDYKVSANNTPSTLKICKAGSSISGYGLEMETSCSTITNNDVYCNMLAMIFEKCFPSDLFRMERDGSLRGNSTAECITQVMSKSFIRNHYKDFKTMWNEYFPAFGISTENNSCGMHVNLSTALFGDDIAKQETACRKLGYIINANYDFFKVAFNRKSSTMWCPKMDSSIGYWKNTWVEDFPTDHSECCINFAHFDDGRLEIRLVGGQKDFACFRNTMETVFHLIDVVKTISWDDCTKLDKVFKGCNSYVFDRLTRCVNECVLSSATLETIRPTVKQVNYI